MPNLSITQQTAVHTDEVTAVKLGLRFTSGHGSETITVEGSAKRTAPDKHDPKIGYDLAFARALQAAAKRLERRANGAVKHQEDIRQMRKTQRQAKNGA